MLMNKGVGPLVMCIHGLTTCAGWYSPGSRSITQTLKKLKKDGKPATNRQDGDGGREIQRKRYQNKEYR